MKRLLDLLFSLLLLIVLSPLFVIVAIAVFVTDGKSPLFIQQRYGKSEKKFNLIKFRTMAVADRQIEDLKDDRRLTKIGKYLRVFHLDELPQLLNILIGDMSFVGPRPIPVAMAVKDIANWQYRGTVRPGLTGLAQVCCTKYTTLRNKFKFDALYVRKRSMLLDLKILLITLCSMSSLIAFVTWTAVILALTLAPVKDTSAAFFPYADKLIHYGMFMLMAMLAVRLVYSITHKFAKSIIIAVIYCALLGVFTECMQFFIVDRSMSLGDFIADIVGIAIALLIVYGEKHDIEYQRKTVKAG